MPPPPPGIIHARTFQPIHPSFSSCESPNTNMVPLVTPRPLHLPPSTQIPPASLNPQLASYFGTPMPLPYGANIDISSGGIAGSFTSTPITSTPHSHAVNPSVLSTVEQVAEEPQKSENAEESYPQQATPGKMHDV